MYMHVYGHVYINKCVYTCVSMCMQFACAHIHTLVCMCVYTYMHLRDEAQLGTCTLEHAHYCGDLQFRKWKNNQHTSMHQAQIGVGKFSLFYTESW